MAMAVCPNRLVSIFDLESIPSGCRFAVRPKVMRQQRCNHNGVLSNCSGGPQKPAPTISFAQGRHVNPPIVLHFSTARECRSLRVDAGRFGTFSRESPPLFFAPRKRRSLKKRSGSRYRPAHAGLELKRGSTETSHTMSMPAVRIFLPRYPEVPECS